MPENGWTEIGTTHAGRLGDKIITGVGTVSIAPLGTPPPPVDYHLHGIYWPCGTCHHPIILLNGKMEIPPGGVTLQWEHPDPGAPNRRRFIPHAQNCADATTRDDDREKGRVYLPATAVKNLTASLPGTVATAVQVITDALLRGDE